MPRAQVHDYLFCVRNNLKGEQFGNKPGPLRFLRVPRADKVAKPGPPHETEDKKTWIDEVVARAKTGENPNTQKPVGDVLVFIHGYNNSQEIVLARQRKLEATLKKAGYKGAVIGFDWPSADSAFNYLEDRDDARESALHLCNCVALLTSKEALECEINVHLLGHSTGAYVIRQGFTFADESQHKQHPWKVSQIAFIGGDVSRRAMARDRDKSTSIYRHCVRLTNYQNPFDSVLKLSNTKRIGVSPRVGRVGLPEGVPAHAVNVDCGEYFEALRKKKKAGELEKNKDFYGTFSHSWHIGDPRFAKDLFHTLSGDVDRHHLPTRDIVDGSLILRPPEE